MRSGRRRRQRESLPLTSPFLPAAPSPLSRAGPTRLRSCMCCSRWQVRSGALAPRRLRRIPAAHFRADRGQEHQASTRHNRVCNNPDDTRRAQREYTLQAPAVWWRQVLDVPSLPDDQLSGSSDSWLDGGCALHKLQTRRLCLAARRVRRGPLYRMQVVCAWPHDTVCPPQGSALGELQSTVPSLIRCRPKARCVAKRGGSGRGRFGARADVARGVRAPGTSRRRTTRSLVQKGHSWSLSRRASRKAGPSMLLMG